MFVFWREGFGFRAVRLGLFVIGVFGFRVSGLGLRVFMWSVLYIPRLGQVLAQGSGLMA